MQIRISKKLSQMSEDELIQLASTSEIEALKVAQEAWNSSSGRANALFKRLSELKTVINNKEVRKFIFKFIEKTGLGGSNVDTFLNLLQSEPRDDEAPLLMSIAVQQKDSLAPQLMLVSKGTPDKIVDAIAVNCGLAGYVDAKKTMTKQDSINKIKYIFNHGIKWNNERGAIFLSKIIAEGSLGNIKEIIDDVQCVPMRFLHYLGREGTPYQRKIVDQTSNLNIIDQLVELQFTGEWPIAQGENKNTLFLKWIANPKVSVEKKIEKFDEIYGRLDGQTKTELIKAFSKIQDRRVFMKLLTMFEKGETDDIESISGNLTFSIPNFSKVISAMNKRGIPIERADQYFVHFVEKMRSKRS